MIFVTVGTHEQPFNRLIHKVDSLIGSGLIKEEVFIQRGIKSVIPINCPSAEMLSYQDMLEKVNNARIVITHGGPGSIMMPLSLGKAPIVVPRQASFGEHVDDHQVDFIRRLEAQKKILAVYEIEELPGKINNYEALCKELNTSGTSGDGIYHLSANIERYCETLDMQKSRTKFKR